MKKNIILLLSIFLLSGCSVQYNLEISSDNISENIKIGKFIATEVKDFEYLTPYAILNDVNQKFYLLEYSNEVLSLSYDYTMDNFEMSEAFNQCYDMSNFSYDDRYYYILTSNEFKCLSYLGYEADEVKINVRSRFKVIESNADYVNDDVYTWVINEVNYKNKPINITFDFNEINKETNKLSSFSIMLMVIAVLLIGVVVSVIIHLFGKKNNKI